ncbi:MAG: aminotransferase class I/II-fold pyridoxal phosphate-dependent enzyme [Gemmatimonadaceae bacterium]|nr:aminotransferase class I/II-fold pyridoxal phosphate-dependent enzyme [Gemmatimonadaceae bacterium]NUS47210.1 aminotransferase class I/II-fold pyridoxal phosphate-dependent enzyme [Gemmatimonadaceae bacterium]
MALVQTATLRSLPPYVFAELDRLKADARARGATLVDLGIGSPDLPMAPAVIDALAAAAAEPGIQGYPPFLGAPRFFDAIGRFMARRFGVTVDAPNEALALSGAKEGIAGIIAALCGPGDVVLVPEIYYPVYARAAWLVGAEVRWMPMRADTGFVLDLDAIPAAEARRAKLMIVNYPNNPTGARVDRAFYDRAVAFATRHDLLLVSDAAYSELTFDGSPAPSALQSDPAREVTLEFHSCSKTFSMAGLRIGFVVGNARAIDALAAYRSNIGYGTATAVQHAAAYALDHHEELVPPKVAAYRSRRDAMANAFRAAGWDVAVPEATMYLWLPVPEGVDDWDWVKALIDRDGVVVTPGVAFGDGGRGFFRISLVRDEATLAAAAARIAARRRVLMRAA